MDYYFLFGGFIVIALIAFFDRVKEVINFASWYLVSIFSKIKSVFWRKYWKSADADENRHIHIFGIKIKLHPICYDGYHTFKNLPFLLLIIIHALITWSWISILPDMIIVYLVQVGTKRLLTKKKEH